MKSYKTTILGVLTILSAIIGAVKVMVSGGAPVDWNAVISAIMAGIGLILAKDHTTMDTK